MNGLEKITERIAADAQAQADDITAQAKAQAAEIVADYQARADAFVEAGEDEPEPEEEGFSVPDMDSEDPFVL